MLNLETFTSLRGKLGSIVSNVTGILEALQLFEQTIHSTNKREFIHEFGITLTIPEGDALATGERGWSEERIHEVWQAIHNMINAMTVDGDTLAAMILFYEAFGGISLSLQTGSFGNAYASTEENVINLYLDPPTTWLRPQDQWRGYAFHTAANLVHEFGHALVFRLGKDNSGIFQEWERIRQLISDFDTPMGWSTTEDWLGAAYQFENQSTLATGGLSRNELEHERIANMFQAFVYGVKPLLNSTNERTARAAWAAYTFMTGTLVPSNVHIDRSNQSRPTGHGILYWMQELARQRHGNR